MSYAVTFVFLQLYLNPVVIFLLSDLFSRSSSVVLFLCGFAVISSTQPECFKVYTMQGAIQVLGFNFTF